MGSRSPAAVVSHGLWGDELRLIGHDLDYPGHQHPEFELQVLTGGSATLLHGGVAHRIQADHPTIFWGGTPHGYLRPEPGEPRPRLTWLTIPIGDLQAWEIDRSFVEQLIGGTVFSIPYAPASGHASEWAAAIKGIGAVQRIAILEITALLLRMTRATAAVCASTVGKPSSSSHAAKALTYLHRHFRSDCPIDLLAQHCDCHPTTLMNAFKKQYGSSIGTYLIQLRVAEAARRLLSTDASVFDVALAAGFRSQSRFYAAFKSAFGQSPGAYRRTWHQRS